MIIKLPKFFDYNNFDLILNQQESIWEEAKKDSKQLIFDVSATEYISILGILLITQIADSIRDKCKCVIRYGKSKQASFMAGLMSIMGVVNNRLDKKIQEYLDNFRVPVQRCHNGGENLKAVNKVIPIIKNEFKPSEEVLKALNWALWELVDNAGMHAYDISEFNINYPHPLYFCAFDYKNTIDIAILDMGKGIQASFLASGKEKYKNVSNEDALKLAIQNGETGNPKGSTGFGLFGCCEIAKQARGKLVIISGSHKLIVSEKSIQSFPCSKFNGTMVSLRIPREVVLNLEKIFGESNIILEPIEDLLGDFNG